MKDEVAGVEFAGLENEGLENDRLENDGVEQVQTYMLQTAAYTFALVLLRHFPVRHFPVLLQTKTNFSGYDPLRHVIVLNTNLTTYIFQHLQLYLLKKMNKQKKS